MYIEIVTPEAVLYKGEISAVAVPSIKGEFQVLEGHAPIIALLGKGVIKLNPTKEADVFVEQRFDKGEKNEIVLPINAGTIEQKDNHIIILAE